jgi:hypothetical protein
VVVLSTGERVTEPSGNAYDPTLGLRRSTYDRSTQVLTLELVEGRRVEVEIGAGQEDALAGRVIGRTGPRSLALTGLVVAAAGLAVPAAWNGTVAMVAGMTVGAAGTGALFVVASATALGQVAAHEAGLASGIVSTFHEFGASLGAAVASSIAALSIGNGTRGVHPSLHHRRDHRDRDRPRRARHHTRFPIQVKPSVSPTGRATVLIGFPPHGCSAFTRCCDG